MADFVINSQTHSAHSLAPFEVTYGYLPHFNIPVGRWTGNASVEQWIEVLREARRDAGVALHLAKRKMKEGFK